MGPQRLSGRGQNSTRADQLAAAALCLVWRLAGSGARDLRRQPGGQSQRAHGQWLLSNDAAVIDNSSLFLKPLRSDVFAIHHQRRRSSNLQRSRSPCSAPALCLVHPAGAVFLSLRRRCSRRDLWQLLPVARATRAGDAREQSGVRAAAAAAAALRCASHLARRPLLSSIAAHTPPSPP